MKERPGDTFKSGAPSWKQRLLEAYYADMEELFHDDGTVDEAAVLATAKEYVRRLRDPSQRIDGPGSPQWTAECEEFGCHEQETDQP